MTKTGKSERPRASLLTGTPLCIDPQDPSSGITFRAVVKEIPLEERKRHPKRTIQEIRLHCIALLAQWCQKRSTLRDPCRWAGIDQFYVTVDASAQEALYRQAHRYNVHVEQEPDPIADGARLPIGEERSEAWNTMIQSMMRGGTTNLG